MKRVLSSLFPGQASVAMMSATYPPVPSRVENPQADADGGEPRPEEAPLPPGVIGYVAVLRGARLDVLTDSSVKTAKEAAAERDVWGSREGWYGNAVVCEVRAAGGQP